MPVTDAKEIGSAFPPSLPVGSEEGGSNGGTEPYQWDLDEYKTPEAVKKIKAVKWLLLYLVFLATFVCVVFLPQDIHTAYDTFASIEGTLLQTEFDIRTTWSDITRVNEVYQFLSVVMLPSLFAQQYYNGDPLPPNEAEPYQPYFQASVSMVMGKIRLRQIRMSPGSCHVAEAVEDISPVCYAPYGSKGLETSPFSWGPNEVEITNFSSQNQLGDGGPWESPKTKTKYTAGGYVEDLPVDSLQDALDAVDVLEQNDWIDEATRIILIDISVYNPNVDQFAFIRLAAERLAPGTVITSSRIEAGALLRVIRSITGDNSSARYFAAFIMSLLLYTLVIVYSLRIADDIVDDWQSFKSYMTDGWNLIDVLMVLFFVGHIVLTFVWMLRAQGLSYVVDPNVEEALWDWDKYYILRQTISLFRTSRYLLAFGVLMCFFKALKFIGITPALQSLTKTVAIAASEMVAVLFVLTVIFCGYGLACVMSFGFALSQFRDFPDSIISLFRMMMGEFDMQELRRTNPAMGSIIFVSFMIVTGFVILSMLLKIVDVAFDGVMTEIKNAKNEDDIARQLGFACHALADEVKWKAKVQRTYLEAHAYQAFRNIRKSWLPALDSMERGGDCDDGTSPVVGPGDTGGAAKETNSMKTAGSFNKRGEGNISRQKSYRTITGEDIERLQDDDVMHEELTDGFHLLTHRQVTMTKLASKLSNSILAISEQRKNQQSAMSLLAGNLMSPFPRKKI